MVIVGVGRVARDFTRLVFDRPGVRIVMAYTRDNEHPGRDLGEWAGVGALGVPVTTDRELAFSTPADIAVIATTSFLRDLAPDIRAAALAGLNVVCTGEELAFPWSVDASLADELDDLARRQGVTILGAGVNPGFLSDALVVAASGAAWDVKRIQVRRVVNCSRFSATILRRLGFGYTFGEFAAGVTNGHIYGHIGFPQSIRMVARRMGFAVERIEKTLEPLLADREYAMTNLKVLRGQTAGFRQAAEGIVGGKPWFRAELLGHADPESAGIERADTIEIDGSNPIHLTIRPGLDAQRTVAAVLANSLRRVVESAPGLVTVVDLPPAAPSAHRQQDEGENQERRGDGH